MAQLPGTEGDKIRKLWWDFHTPGGITGKDALDAFEVAWDLLPASNRESWDESYLIAEAIIELSIELGTLERGKRWLDSAMVADPGRNDAGGRELLVGKWFFANGELDKAKELFSIANAKSRGRIFAGADPRYRALVAETNPQTQKKKRGK